MNSLLSRSTLIQASQVPLTELHVMDSSDMKIRLDDNELYMQGTSIPLTKKETVLLVTLAKSKQRVFTRKELVEEMFGIYYRGGYRIVDTHIKNIRKKLNSAGLEYSP